MDLESALVLLGILATFIVSIGGLAWNIRATQIQTKHTERMTRLTSELQKEINRLSIELDQRVTRIRKAQDLLHEIFKTQVYLDSSGNSRKGNGSTENLWAYAGNRARIAEFRALIHIINDQQLIKLMDGDYDPTPSNEDALLGISNDVKWQSERWLQYKEKQTEQIYERLNQLLEELTKEKNFPT